MSYGFRLRNALGEDILDRRRALYIQSSGLTVRPQDIGIIQTLPGGSFDAGPGRAADVPATRYIATGSAPMPESDPFNQGFKRRIPTPLWPKSAMAFYRPTVNGLCFSLEVYLGPIYSAEGTSPGQGLVFLSLSAGGGLPGPGVATAYIVVDTAPGPVSGDYGMRIRDASGEVTFDSRAGLFSIAEVIFVPSAVVGDILDNDAVHDFALRKAMPGCYISIPYFAAFAYVTSPMTGLADDVRPRIRQVAPDLLRIDRQVVASTDTGLRPRYAHDLAIFVARDPFA